MFVFLSQVIASLCLTSLLVCHIENSSQSLPHLTQVELPADIAQRVEHKKQCYKLLEQIFLNNELQQFSIILKKYKKLSI